MASKSEEKARESKGRENSTSFLIPVAIILSAVIVSFAVIYTGSNLTDSDDGSALGANEETADNGDSGDVVEADTGGEVDANVLRQFETFTEYDTEICKDGGKPIVYLFSTTWCPHCTWIIDTFDSWAKDNSDKVVVYHWELDTGDNTITDEVETEVPDEHNDVYKQFNPSGSIPTFVFGCKYARVGNGYEAEDDLEQERSTFDAILQEIL